MNDTTIATSKRNADEPSRDRAGLREWIRRIRGNLVDRLLGYDVFISYAWVDGRAYAESLSAALRQRASWRKRLVVFLDDTEMAAGSPLRATIGRALQRSGLLVVVATPMAFRSGHVADEVRTFKLLDKNIVPIAPADIVARFRQQMPLDATTVELPQYATDATPETCERFMLATLRQYIWVEEATSFSADAPSMGVVQKIRNSVGSLHRARLRTVTIGAVAAVFLAVAFVAYIQRYEAVAQQERAEQSERLAVSRQLAAQSTAAAGTQLDRALLLALAAGSVGDTQEADQALLNAAANGPPVVAYMRGHLQAISAILPLAGIDGGVLTADMAGVTVRWTARGQKVDAVDLGGGPIRSLAQLTDGTIAVGSYDGGVTLLDTDSLSPVGRIATPRIAGQSASVLWRSSNGELIVGYSGSDVQNGIVVRWTKRPNGTWASDSQLQLDAGLTSIALSPDEATLAIGTSNGQVALWTLDRGTVSIRNVSPPSLRQPETYIKSLAFHPSGKWLAFDDGDGTVHVVDFDRFQVGRSATCHRHPNDVYQITFLGELLLSVGADAKLRLASVSEDCTALAAYQVTAKSLQSIAVIDAKARMVVSGSGDGSAQLWDLARVSPSGLVTATGPSVPSNIAFSADDLALALTGLITEVGASDRGFVRAYRTADLTPLSERLRGLKGPATATLFVQGQAPVILGFDGWLEWPSLNSTEYVKTNLLSGNAVVWPGELLAVKALKVVIAYLDGTIALYDATTGENVWRRSLWPTGPNVRSAAISPDGRHIAIGAVNGWIQILDGATGKDIGKPLTDHRLEVTALSFGRDSDRLYSGSTDAQLLIWKLGTRTAARIENAEGSIQALARTDDESMIAASTQRGIIALWTRNGTRFLGTLETGIVTPITALRFDHSGRRLAAASIGPGAEPGGLAIWEVGTDSLRERACAIAARGFTSDERTLYRVPPAVSPCQ